MKAANRDQPLLAEVELVQRHIYFLEVSWINNVLSVLLYKMISLRQKKSEGVWYVERVMAKKVTVG